MLGVLPDRQETPFAGHALELVCTAVLEINGGSCDQVFDRIGNENLPSGG